MNDLIPASPAPGGEFLLYQTEDGRTRIQCRFENETIWLTQVLIAELFQITVPTVNEHLKGIFAEGELEAGATIRKFRIVRSEGRREVTREIEHYRLEAIGKLIPDLIVDGKVIADPKVVSAFNDTHLAQMLGYLNITGLQVALLVNFKESKLTWKRVVNERRNLTADDADDTDRK